MVAGGRVVVLLERGHLLGEVDQLDESRLFKRDTDDRVGHEATVSHLLLPARLIFEFYRLDQFKRITCANEDVSLLVTGHLRHYGPDQAINFRLPWEYALGKIVSIDFAESFFRFTDGIWRRVDHHEWLVFIFLLDKVPFAAKAFPISTSCVFDGLRGAFLLIHKILLVGPLSQYLRLHLALFGKFMVFTDLISFLTELLLKKGTTFHGLLSIAFRQQGAEALNECL